MGIVAGAMTVQRFRVVGELPASQRTAFLQANLQAQAFVESPVEQGKEEREGFVLVDQLLGTDFSDINRWYIQELVVFALRVDKKTLPAKLFKAHLAKQVKAWCDEHQMQRCPRSIKDELSEQLEQAWLARALPRVSLTEVCFHTTQGYCIVHSLSDGVAERLRKRFFAAFGLKLVPWSPLDWLDASLAQAALETTPSVLRGPEHD